jgi:uncharacterized membrane protein
VGDLKKKLLLLSVILGLLIVLAIVMLRITNKGHSGESIEEAINHYSERINNPLIVENVKLYSIEI